MKSFRGLRLAACLIAAAMATVAAPDARAQTPIKFSLDGKLEGQTAPFLVPIDKGYYKSEGLDVTVDPAASSIEAITRVATGGYDMAFADINTLIRYRDQNPASDLRAVFMVYNKAPYAVIGRKSRGVAKPADLEGKKLGAPAADSAFAQWKIFAKSAGIDASKVTIENIGLPVREPMLAAGQVDAITGFAFSSFVNLKDRGVAVDDIVVMPMSDYGMNLYGGAIIVSGKLAGEKPDAVKGFLRAFIKGLKDSAKDQPAAIESVLKRNDAAKKDVEVERLRMVLRDNILTAEVKAGGYGAVDTKRFAESIEQTALAYEFKDKAKAATAFDPAFLPPANERKAP